MFYGMAPKKNVPAGPGCILLLLPDKFVRALEDLPTICRPAIMFKRPDFVRHCARDCFLEARLEEHLLPPGTRLSKQLRLGKISDAAYQAKIAGARKIL